MYVCLQGDSGLPGPAGIQVSNYNTVDSSCSAALDEDAEKNKNILSVTLFCSL